MPMKWYGDKVTKDIMRELGDRLEISARMLENEAKEQLSHIDGASMPGEYPHKQTGHLRRNTASEVDRINLRARWGTNVLYGKFLELGTKYMASRPWMRKTNKKLRKKIERILGASME